MSRDQGIPEGDPAAVALVVAKRLLALPEPGMRRAALVRRLADAPPPWGAGLLAAWLEASRTQPAPEITAALTTVAETLVDDGLMPMDTRVALYAAARDDGLDEVAHLLLRGRPSSTGNEASGEEPEPEQVLVPLPQGKTSTSGQKRRTPGGPLPGELRGRALTLGHRKSLARSPRREILDYLMRDPDPRVIEVLLGNPRLVERDVLFVASRRPVRGEVLRVVFQSRWLARYQVKRSLILNPYCPHDVAIGLLGTLNTKDVAEIAGNPKLSDELREQARRLLAVVKRASGEGEVVFDATDARQLTEHPSGPREKN